MDEVSPSAMPSTPSPAMRASLIVEMMRHVDFARHRAADAPLALRDPSMIAEAAEVVTVAGPAVQGDRPRRRRLLAM